MIRRTLFSGLCWLVFPVVLGFVGCSPTGPKGETEVLPEYTYTTTQVGELAFAALGDDTLTLAVNGIQVGVGSSNATVQGSVSGIRAGKNVVTAEVTNPFLGGGFFGYLALPVYTFDTSVVGRIDTTTLLTDVGFYGTDSTWKYSFAAPAGWQEPDFDDSDWRNAASRGSVDKAVQLDPAVLAAKMFDSTTSADFIWSSRDLYFRKTFTVATAGPCVIQVSGNDGTDVRSVYDVWLNDVKIIDRDSMPGDTATMLLHRIPGSVRMDAHVVAGTNVLAVQLTDTANGSGARFIAEVWRGEPATGREVLAVSDSSWKCNDREQAGWTTVGFDDSQWYPSGVQTSSNGEGGYTIGGWTGSRLHQLTWVYQDTADTVLHDVKNCEDSLFIGTDPVTGELIIRYDTISCVTREVVDTFYLVNDTTAAWWLCHPNTVYFRYEFDATVQ